MIRKFFVLFSFAIFFLPPLVFSLPDRNLYYEVSEPFGSSLTERRANEKYRATALYQDQIFRILRQPALQSANVGILAVFLDSGKPVFSYHADQSLIPASNLKLFCSACALVKLGLGYRFVTKIFGEKIEKGHVRGNLIVKGSGDPTWSKDFYPESTVPLMTLGNQLWNRGIREVDGDLVVDDSAFDRDFSGKGWKTRYQWEEYAAEVGGLSLNHNEVTVAVLPAQRPGSPGRIVVWPQSHVLRIVNRTWTSSSRSTIRYRRYLGRNLAVVSGGISRYSPGISFLFNIYNPPIFASSAFREILRNRGIRVRGRVRLVQDGENLNFSSLTPLAEIYSPPLYSILMHMNKESDNFLAEHLFRTLGAVHMGKGSLEMSEKSVFQCLAQLGIHSPVLHFADGSGLSTEDRASPATLVALLEAMMKQPLGVKFRETLPRGGERKTTLEDRLKDVFIEAKTGALQGVNSLSGYVETKSGKTIVFSILLNQFSCSSDAARDLIDQIIHIFANMS